MNQHPLLTPNEPFFMFFCERAHTLSLYIFLCLCFSIHNLWSLILFINSLFSFGRSVIELHIGSISQRFTNFNFFFLFFIIGEKKEEEEEEEE